LRTETKQKQRQKRLQEINRAALFLKDFGSNIGKVHFCCMGVENSPASPQIVENLLVTKGVCGKIEAFSGFSTRSFPLFPQFKLWKTYSDLK